MDLAEQLAAFIKGDPRLVLCAEPQTGIVLWRPSDTETFDKVLQYGTSIAALVVHDTALVSLVAPASVPRVVVNDADDDQVIAAAVAARA